MTANAPPFDRSWQRVSPGTRLNNIYEVDQPIGVGGMGEIYKGHVIETGDPVAIKLMLPELAANDAALTLFRKEASALHYVHHDAIVRYYVFTVEPVLRRPYLAMEFVEGRSLSDILQDDGPLSFEAVRLLMQRLASGLQAAHERSIIHRDVSPDNIIIPLGDVSRAKIIDFGIARSTQHGTVIGSGFAGKFNYVSPEQLGLFGGDVTARSDIYSLGLVLVQALIGRPIDMGGSQVEIVEKRRKVPDLGAIDMRLRPLLEKMLQPDPARRPDSMAAVAGWQVGSGSSSGYVQRGAPIGARNRAAAQTGGSRRRWRYALATLAGVAVIGSAGAYYQFVVITPIVPNSPQEPHLTPGGSSFSSNGNTAPSTQLPVDRQNSRQPTEATNRIPSDLDAAKAGMQPSAQAGSALPGSRTDSIRRYVEQYDGGDCFFITPVALGSGGAALEGFGTSAQPFDTLAKTFKQTQGFDPTIGIRQVTQAQCPAIAFLNRIRTEKARAPRIEISSTTLRGGETLTGSIGNFGNRVIELFLVSDRGIVQSLSYLLKPGTDALTFQIGMQRVEGPAGAQPQLLMAVAGPRVIDSLRPTQPVAADQFFLLVQSEASRGGLALTASARYFVLEK
jgi:serine/threonine protein kinase